MSRARIKRRLHEAHPYLSGNFAPIDHTITLTPCSYTGTIPRELAGGEYVRNGANPLSNADLGRDAHAFDGDGMLCGVLFKQSVDGVIQPEFTNQYVRTDVYLSELTSPSVRTPILPSIATLVDPASTLLVVLYRILRAVLLAFISFLPGSKQAIRRISVANTAVVYHDGRALATCESGPPMRVQLPELETVGWYNSGAAEGEPGISEGAARDADGGVLAWMKEWATGHPKVDPVTNELIMFHATFLPPYVRYTVTPKDGGYRSLTPSIRKEPIPGVSGARMMHDFGVSESYTIIMDLPLTLDPLNLAKGKPVMTFEREKLARFGVFPRHRPTDVRWFETSGCLIFHTANAWDEYDTDGNVTAVNLLACRLNSDALVYATGNIAVEPPPPKRRRSVKRRVRFRPDEKEPTDAQLESLLHASPTDTDTDHDDSDGPDSDECRLHHYRFSLRHPAPTVTHSRALAALPFEFPTVRPDRAGRFARHVYGASARAATFGAALGRATKIDVLVKVDVRALLARHADEKGACLDRRTVAEILASGDERDAVRAFAMPAGWVAQEAFFVPSSSSSSASSAEKRNAAGEGEDDGYLLFYAFDEAQLDARGACPPHAISELWVLDAKNMRDVVARVRLPQRVPYGFHGRWFSEAEIGDQRPVERFRGMTTVDGEGGREESTGWQAWMAVREWVMRLVG